MEDNKQQTYESWCQDRDKWYVTTLTDAGILFEDVLEGKWEKYLISLKVDIEAGTETLMIAGEQIGDVHTMHPMYKVRLQQAEANKKIIKPGES